MEDSDSTRSHRHTAGWRACRHPQGRRGVPPDPDAALYVANRRCGEINLADLLAPAPTGMDPGDFERRVSILYNGDGEQRRRMLDHWDDPDYMYDPVARWRIRGMRSP